MEFKVFYYDSETKEEGTTYILCVTRPTKEEVQERLQSECCLGKNKLVKSIRKYTSKPKQKISTEQDLEWELRDVR